MATTFGERIMSQLEPDIHTAVYAYFHDLLKLRCKKTLDFVAKTKTNDFSFKGDRFVRTKGGFVVTVANLPVFAFSMDDNLFYLKAEFPKAFANPYVRPGEGRRYGLGIQLGPQDKEAIMAKINNFRLNHHIPMVSIDFSEPSGLLEAEYYINTLLSLCVRLFRVRHKQLHLRESVLDSCDFGVELPDLLNFVTTRRNNNPAFRKVPPQCVSAS